MGQNGGAWDDIAELFRLVEKAGILVTQASSEQYIAVLEDDAQGDMALVRACFAEAATTGSRPHPKWLRSVVWRCRKEGCMPGEWRNKDGGNGARASPPSQTPENYMTPEAIRGNELAFSELPEGWDGDEHTGR